MSDKMPSTNKTPNIGIGQYLPNDILSWNDINADNTLVDTAVGNKLDKTDGGTVTGAVNFTGGLTKNGKNVAGCETGTFPIRVIPSQIGITSVSTYSIIGNKCFVDFQVNFNGTGSSSTSTEVIVFSSLPVPVDASKTNKPLGFVSYTTKGVYVAGYININTSGTFAFAFSRGIGDFTHLIVRDIREGTNLRGQFCYEITQ